jgi:hypothetical protein
MRDFIVIGKWKNGVFEAKNIIELIAPNLSVTVFEEIAEAAKKKAQMDDDPVREGLTDEIHLSIEE